MLIMVATWVGRKLGEEDKTRARAAGHLASGKLNAKKKR